MAFEDYYNGLTFEEWKNLKKKNILAKYEHLNLSLDILYKEHFTPEEKSEFMSPQEYLTSVRDIQAEHSDISSDKDQYIQKKAKEFADKFADKPKLGVSAEQLKFMIEYFREVKKPYKSLKFAPKKDFSQLMDYKEASNLFYHKYLQNLYPDTDFIIDEHNSLILRKLTMYFIRDKDVTDLNKIGNNPLDLKKGIFLFGTVGTGKTSLMEAFSDFTNDLDLPTKFNMNDFDKTSAICSSKEGLPYIHKFNKYNWCHDEVIPEKKKHFGNEISPTGYLIKQQYKRFTKSGNVTHFTSNAQPNQLREILDAREYRRINQMSNFIFLGGPCRS